jgi:hypothetical protein
MLIRNPTEIKSPETAGKAVDLRRREFLRGGVLHFFRLLKSDLRQPLLYAAAVSLLPGYRPGHAALRRRSGAAGPAARG